MFISRDHALIFRSASPSRRRGTTPSCTMKSGDKRPTALNALFRPFQIAIRSAVGAQRRDILRLILGEGLRLIASGLLLGTGVALLLGKLLSSLLFEVHPADPATLIGATLLYAAVGLVACWVPARRAAKVDLMEALRCE